MNKVNFVEVNHGGDLPNKPRQVFLDEKPALEIDIKNQRSISSRFRSKHDFYDQVRVAQHSRCSFVGNRMPFCFLGRGV